MDIFLKKCTFTLFLGLAFSLNTFAQNTNYVGQKGQLYFSWGYNKEWYTKSNIHIRQEGLGNNYTFRNVIGKDKPGWDDKSIFKQAISIPQYNYRLGYWFKDDWAFEINFDHTKFQVEQEQLLQAKGKMNFLPIDTQFINRGNLKWQLNNGANFFLFNIVRRYQVPRMQYKNFNISLLMKGGIGFVIPHVENTILGNSNDKGFQFGGWDIGLEAALRFTFFKYAYLEYCNKAVYARYSNLKIYEGTARQAFGCYEMIANIGVSFPICKNKKNSELPSSIDNEIVPINETKQNTE
jgi:hypothetical protein